MPAVPRTIVIVSDGTGETAYRVMRAALAQFKDTLVGFKWQQGVRSIEQVDEVVATAASLGALIAYSLVLPDLRQELVERSRVRGVECFDVIGPALLHLSDWLGAAPMQQPGLAHQIDADYFQRIVAMEFMVQHDDGRNPDQLDQADLVLVGVSRTSKTPLSVYFAYRGWLVGNVPIVLGIEPPPLLFQLARERVIGLSVRPERLAALRGERQRRMGMGGSYADPATIREEMLYAQSIFTRGGWAIVDMSVRSIEEAAAEILALIGRE